LTLIDIDPVTGAGTVRGNFAAPVSALEFRSDGVLFGTTGGGNASLVTIDPETGDFATVGVHDFGAVTGLQFIGDTLYGAFFAPPDGTSPYSLVTIDQADGSLTTIGSIDDYSSVRGLAYDVNSATLYGVGIPLLMGESTEGVNDELFTIDPGTAMTTPVGTIGFSLGGLEFGPDGQLLGGTDGGGGGEGAGSTSLVSVNTQTGLGTVIGSTGQPAISALAYYPDAQAAVIEVPTVGDLGLVFLALLLAAGGWLFTRRVRFGQA
jgi:hypothetical protein